MSMSRNFDLSIFPLLYFFLTSDQEIGADIVLKALRQPAYHIASNAGVDANRIVERTMRESGKNKHFYVFHGFVNCCSSIARST